MSDDLEEISEQMADIAADLTAEDTGRRKPSGWATRALLTTSVWAVFCSVAALTTAFAADREVDDRNQELMAWDAAEAEATQAVVVAARDEILSALAAIGPRNGDAQPVAGNLPVPHPELEMLVEQQEADLAKVDALQAEVDELAQAHHVLAVAITLFQLAITLCATSLVFRRRLVWYASVAFGALGTVLTGIGVVDFLRGLG